MKTAVWFTFLLLLMPLIMPAQELNKTIQDSRFDVPVLIGYCDRDGLNEGDFGDIFHSEYDGYAPAKKYVRKLKKQAVDYSITLVLGTWCHDSREQVPRFYKVLDEAGIPGEVMEVICVDGYKKAGEIDLSSLNIERVPTFIFYREGEELGKIVETPEKSLEKDFLKIIRK